MGSYQWSIILRGNNFSANCQGLIICWAITGEAIFGGAIIRGAIILRGNYPAGNYPVGNCPGGNCPEGNCPGGNYPEGICPGGNYLGGQFSCSHLALSGCFRTPTIFHLSLWKFYCSNQIVELIIELNFKKKMLSRE